MSLDTLFAQAIAPASDSERAAFLDEACQGDAELRRDVEQLVRDHFRAGAFLEQPAVRIGATVEDAPSERPGTVIAHYKLVEPIGEGGMGRVWMAQQTEPVKRLVAIKLIKAGMDSKQVLARFEAERQALALMDHPNIARVLDAGTTSAGRPYFVMDLVKGVPITKYCDAHHLTPRQRLDLFIPVCQAVQHAHQKGIIHRDLKPSNVLVALYDGKPVPKVIDFGVAKAAGQPLTEKTLVTGFGHIVGTLEYMSPEQAAINALDIDTRSDIYSLGVLLYELLAGSPPFNRKDLEKAGMLEMLRVIREQEPSKPSTKLSTAEGLPTLAANRGTEPGKLTKLVRGELDWIVMKALEKDRSRRYETANGLARDIQRYLADELVEARPPSTGYRLRKFAWKYRAAVFTTAAVAAALVLGTVVASWQAVRAVQAEAVAVAERDAKEAARQAEEAERQLAVAQRDRAVRAEQEAKHQAAVALAVNNFLQHDLLAQASPWSEPVRDLKLRTVLDRAAQKIEGKFDQQPLVEAAIRKTIATAYIHLDLMAPAQKHLERALELRRRRLGEGHRLTLATANQLALTLRIQGNFAEAESLWRKTLEVGGPVLGEEDPEMAETMNHLAYLLQRQGRLADAEPLYERALAIRRRVFGEEDPRTLDTRSRLAGILQKQSKLSPAEAEAVVQNVLEIHRRVRGNAHPDTLTAIDQLAGLLRRQGKLEEAEQLSREALGTGRRVFGEEHSYTLGYMTSLGRVLRDRGDYAAAEPLLAKSLEGRRRIRSDGHYLTLGVIRDLANLYQEQRKYDQAEPLRVEEVEFARRLHSAEHPDLAQAQALLGWTRLQQRKFLEAEAVLREALVIYEKRIPDDWVSFDAKSMLGGALLGQRKYADAEPLVLQGYEGMKQRAAKIPPVGKPHLRETIERLVQLYDAWGKPEQAAEWRKQLEEQ